MEKKPIGRSVRRNLLRSRLLFLYGVAALTSFAIFVMFWCTNIYRDVILSSLELRNGSSSFIWWQRPPVNVVYKVYVFNYTNVREFERGTAKKLRVEETGPYVYREMLNRVNVEVHENGTLTYQEKRSFEWLAGKSEEEKVLVPNIPLMSTVAFSRNIPYFMQVGLTALLTTFSVKPFLELPVGEFLWGYDDDIFKIAKPFVSLKQKLPYEKFGILAFKSGVNDDRITMHTGVDDLRSLGMIQRVNGMEIREIWGDETCDRVYGTDGSMFPPYTMAGPNATLHVYAKDICRTIPFRYQKRSYSHGIPTYRYQIPSDAFTSTDTKDSCFCAKKNPDSEDSSEESSSSKICPPAGIFNVSACSFGTPLLVSFPHFYAGNESLLEQIEGLTPNPERHQSYIDIHPGLGVTIDGWSRFQLNLEARKARGVPFLEKLRDGTILPLIWIDTGIEEMPDSVQATLYNAHYLVNGVEAVFQWCSLIGVVLSFGALIAALKRDALRPEQETELQTDVGTRDKLISP